MHRDRERTSEDTPDPLEQELAAALRRVAAPDDFTEKVMRQVRTGPGSSVRVFQLRWAWAVAAMLLLAILSIAHWQRGRTQEAALATQQFALAMRITHTALLNAGQHLDRRAYPGARSRHEAASTIN